MVGAAVGEAGKQLREKEDSAGVDWASMIVGSDIPTSYDIGDDLPFLPGFQGKAFPMRGGEDLPSFCASTIRPDDAAIIRLAYLYPMTWENVRAFLCTLPAGPNLEEAVASHGKFNLSDEEFKHLYQPFWHALRLFVQPGPGLRGWEIWSIFSDIAQATLLCLSGQNDEPLHFGYLEGLAAVVAALWDEVTSTGFSSPGHAVGGELARQGFLLRSRLGTQGEYRNWIRHYGNPYTSLSKRRTVASWTGQAREIIADGGQAIHTCENCGRLFLQATARREFCSNYCRQKRHRDRKKKESDILGGTC